MYYLQSRYYDPEVSRFINADDVGYLGADGNLLSYNLFAYCENNPMLLTDFSGDAPEWWQWSISCGMVIAGVAMVATGVGGFAGGALIGAGVNSIVGSYLSEYDNGSSVAGWAGGMVTGAFCGAGASAAGSLFLKAADSAGLICLAYLSYGELTAFSSGAMGSLLGQSVSLTVDGKKMNVKKLLYSSISTGAINCIAGIGSEIGGAIASMPAISTTTIGLSNSLNAFVSIASEIFCDFVNTVTGLF